MRTTDRGKHEKGSPRRGKTNINERKGRKKEKWEEQGQKENYGLRNERRRTEIKTNNKVMETREIHCQSMKKNETELLLEKESCGDGKYRGTKKERENQREYERQPVSFVSQWHQLHFLSSLRA